MARSKRNVIVNVRQKPKKKKSRSATLPSEIGFIGKALRSLGALGGAAVGGMYGQPAAGSAIGNSLGASLSRWLGSGDYTVGTNTLVSRVQSGSPAIPMMHNEGQSVIVRHKEFIGEIRGSTAFTVQQIHQLNPGLSYTFPWLSRIAAQYAEYRIKGAVFHYVPTSGDVATTTNGALGTVMIQTSYRATDTPPTSKVEMLNEYWASEASPTDPFCHPLECDPKENPYNVQYVRTGELTSSDSQLLYDLGTTYVATSGQQASGNVLGDLWLTYEIELRKPVIASSVSSPVKRIDSASLNYVPSTTSWFGDTKMVSNGNLLVTYDNSNGITFPKGLVGVYTIVVTIRSATTFTSINMGGVPTYSNCLNASYNIMDPSPADFLRTVLTGTGNINLGTYACCIIIPDPQMPAKITFPTSTWVGTPTSTLVSITQKLGVAA